MQDTQRNRPASAERLPESDPTLPALSGAIVRETDSPETKRLAMDRNRALLYLGSQMHGTGFLS